MIANHAPSQVLPLTQNSKLQGKDVGIPVRKLGLTYGDDLPAFWFNDNAFLTMFFSIFSALLPEGESQFIYSVRLFQEKITDPILLAQVRAFIGQEAHHSREHQAINTAMISKGFPLDRIEKRLRTLNKWRRENHSAAKLLASTVCSEHLTALMSDYALRKNPSLLESFAPQIRKSWAWHCIEEIEHKAVAFDVYMQEVGDRKLLRRTMIEITIFFFVKVSLEALRMMPKTGQMTHFKMWREAFSTLNSLIKESRSDYMDFYKPDFHPWQHNHPEILQAARLQYLNEV